MNGETQSRESFAYRLNKAMFLRDMSVAQLARATGIAESTIHRYLADQSEPIFSNLIDIAVALKADLNFLSGMDAVGADDMAAAFVNKLVADVKGKLGVQGVTEGPSRSDAAAVLGRLPVLGLLSESDGMEFTDQGYPAGASLYFIPSLGDTARHAYGLAVDDDSMTPRIQRGDIVVCCPDENWESGDLVAVRTSSGHILLRLIQDRDSSYVLRSYDPSRDLVEMPSREVSFVHKATSIRPGAHARHIDSGYER
jgi:SOS-response transcriptional repressor LexA/DNA-binding Xre family transcriptional regulator